MKLSKKSKLILLSCLFLLVTSYGLLVFFSKTTLIVDNKAHIHYSLIKGTVKELLDLFQVSVSSKDIVQPELKEKVRWGQRVEIIRVTETTEQKDEIIDFILDWKRRTSKNLRKVEIQEGHREQKNWTVKRTFHNGKEVDAQKSLKKVTKTPLKRIILFNKQGYAEKIYDLSKVKKVRVIATAYWIGDPQVPDVITFSGHPVERGLVAVDPTVIPLGCRLFVPGYGYAYSSDTGSAIKGNRIDLFVENKQASRKWEHVKADVYILEKAKKW